MCNLPKVAPIWITYFADSKPRSVFHLHTVLPCHIYAYNHANTHTFMLKKNLIFPNFEFGKKGSTLFTRLNHLVSA